MVGMSQKLEIMKMLKAGNCTSQMIFARFGKGATRRLRVLREEGYLIETTRLAIDNYAYRLVGRSSHAKKKKVSKPRIIVPKKPESVPMATVGSYEYWAERRRIINGLVWPKLGNSV